MKTKGNNIFKILNLYDKEEVFSDMLAWLLDPSQKHLGDIGFGKEPLAELLRYLECKSFDLNKDSRIRIIREYYTEYNGEKNFIDILIIIEDRKNNDKRILCIENKIKSGEGYNQTKRYTKSLENEFPGEYIEYRYITKNNSPVILSSDKFKHFSYWDLANFFKKFLDSSLVNDFYEVYIEEPKIRVRELDKKDKILDNNELDREMSYYLTNKIMIDGNKDIYTSVGVSIHSRNFFFQAWKTNWNIEINGLICFFHLEGGLGRVALHFETLPYIPFSRLDKDIKDKIIAERDRMRIKVDNISLDKILDIEKYKVRSNANLTVSNYRFKSSNYIDFYNSVMDLMEVIDELIIGEEYKTVEI